MHRNSHILDLIHSNVYIPIEVKTSLYFAIPTEFNQSNTEIVSPVASPMEIIVL